ncbi:MAG TPA: hypothetical protein VNH11_27980 [Pirellulales bacterium]|nr:hypothetical protein [Pirellulales bacterium]
MGTIAVFAVAAGAFAAPPSLVSGLLVLILATCTPGLLLIVWRSGGGYRRSFVIGAAAPSIACAYRWLKLLDPTRFRGTTSVAQIVEHDGVWPRFIVLTYLAIALGGGLAGVAVHWLMAGRSGGISAEQNGESHE